MINAVTSVLKPLETSSSLGLFARDTGGCLLSRLSLSRSKQERKEISLSEISESLIFYFSAPLLAKLSGKIMPYLTKNPELIKTGQILSTFGIILPLVYAIAPLRNLMTLSQTGQDEFVSVIGLKEDKKEAKSQDAKAKAKDLIKNMGLISLAALLSVPALISVCKNEKIYNSIKPIIEKFNKNLGFNKEGDLKLMHYAALIYPASILGYFKASRDKYEKWENARRFSVTVPLLFLGDKVIEKPIHKFFDKKFNTSVMDKNGIKSYDEILKMPNNVKNQFFKTKNWAFGLNFLVSTILVAGGVALLNRIQTKKNYEKENNLNKNV